MVKVNINNKSKEWYKSKTFTLNLLLIIAGVSTWVSGEIAAGSVITIPALLNALLRVVSKQEIKF